MKRWSQVSIAIVCVVLGMLLALQFRTHQRASADLSARRMEELAAALRSAERERDKLKEEVASLREGLAKAVAGQSALEEVRRELTRVRMAAGLIDVKGPGLEVILDDSKRVTKPSEDPNVFIIHDDDILKVLNELFAAGAEAVAVNGQRVVATTEIRCAGPTISVNNTRIAPPIHVLAIGDPEVMEAALRMRGGVVESLTFWGIEVRIKRYQEVVVPAYKGSLQFRYVQPAGGQV